MKRVKRFLSLFLSVCLLLGLLPSTALALNDKIMAENIQIGDFLSFGTFNDHPMLWQVVDNTNGKLKIFSTDILFNGPIDAEINMHGNASVMEGETNWHTSDIRQYLNSNDSTVSYKGELPNYGSLPGFLTNFTSDELALIQDTTHKSLVHYSTSGVEKDGGTKYARDTFFNGTSFDIDAYNELAYVNVTEKVFLPDMMDLRELRDNGLGYTRYAYSEYSDSFVETADSGFFTRTPVYSVISAFSTTYYYGVYYVHTWFGTSTAEAERGIRPMCYIQLDNEQTITGSGTLESPYALEFGSDDAGDPDELQLISCSPDNRGTFTGNELVVSMTFSREIESVQTGISFDENNNTVIHGNFSIVRQIEEADGWEFETVYSLSEGDNVENDVTIDGNTVTIDASDAELVLGETYYVLMDTGVITFNDTDEVIGFGGTEWVFSYHPTASLSGFSLGKHNNSFLHASSGERAGFKGVNGHSLSWNKYVELIDYADVLNKLKLTLQINSSGWNGSCYGIASTMLLAYKNELNLSQFESGVNYYYDMPLPCENEDFLESIEYFYLSQCVMDYHGAKDEQIAALLPDLLLALTSNPVLFSYRYEGGGHAILALDYRVDEEGNYAVWMYDMNSYNAENHGAFTLLQIAKDFSDYSLTLPNGRVLEKDDLYYIQFSTIDQINEINPYLSNDSLNTDERLQEINSEVGDTIVITVPMSDSTYTIENSLGETLVCDENGHFSGTMELINIDGFFSDENDDSLWELTVKSADYFHLSKPNASIDINFFTSEGCLGIKSEDISNVTFVINDSIVIEDDVATEEYTFTTFLSHNMIEDDSIRIVQASALANGKTIITIDENRLLMSATKKLEGKELVLINNLDKYPLTDLNEADNIIETLTSLSSEGDGEIATYTVTYTDGVDGKEIFADQTYTVEEGAETPAFAGTPRLSGYTFMGWTPEVAATVTVDATYTATWQKNSSGGGVVIPTVFPVTVKDSDNGEVTASSKYAAPGTTVKLTVTPDEGYELDTLTVKYGSKEVQTTLKNGKYQFTMPFAGVTVTATFKKIETPVVPDPVVPSFDDVAEDTYYFDAVEWAVENGITTGTSDTTFSPDMTCTRAQAVTFLWRAAGSPEPKSNVMPFEDVAAEAYYYKAVLWAVENGITNGTSATTFSPDADCTRAQIVTFLWRSQKSPAITAVNPFADIAADAYYYDAVLWAVDEKITNGTSETTFGPDADCTRAQIVTFLYRCLGDK